MPGPQPTPTALKRARGTLRERNVRNEPKPPAGLIAVPADVRERPAAFATWKSLAPIAERMGTLTTADVEAFALGCHAFADHREARAIVKAEGAIQIKTTDRGGTSRVAHPATALAADAWRRGFAFLDRFGLTPAARARLVVTPKPTEDDPFAEFDGAVR